MTAQRHHQEDDATLAAEYVLGLLEQPERAQFAARLATDPALRDEVRHWEEHFAGFTEEIAPVVPPPALRNAIEQRLFTGTTRQRPETGMWNSLAFWRGLAAASLAAVVALGAWNLRPATEQGAPLTQVAEVAGTEGKIKLVALYDPTRNELRLNRVAGTPAQNRGYELWLIAGNEAPVSLGVLPASTTSTIVVPEHLRAKVPAAVLAISDEPATGSPTGQATGPILAIGQLTAI
ncbi:MAG: anti-sigma factor [Hyphomicrobiales bacterium]